MVPVVEHVPDPEQFATDDDRKTAARSLEYMGLEAGKPMQALNLDRVFIGSCTNSRIEDLRAAAAVVRGYHVANTLHAMVVPGSGQVKNQAESEARSSFQSRWVRLARSRLQHVPRHEPRYPYPRPTLRQHQQPQFRRTAGQRGKDPLGVPGNGGGGGDCGAFCGCAGVGI